MNKKLSLLLIIIFVATYLVNAQDGGLQKPESKSKISNLAYDKIDRSITKSIDAFFDLLVKNDVGNACDNLLKNSPIWIKKDNVKNLKDEIERSINIYGDVMMFEYVSGEQVTESYIRLRFLALHKNYPTRWVFTYYKSPEKGWIVTNVKMDDASENFFED